MRAGDAPDPAAGGADQLFQALLLRIGTLNYVWTNTESLLIHLIAGLGKMPKDTAMVVFLTINTSRARLELVERLAKMSTTPKDQREAALDLTARFQREAPLRNKFNHCIYSFDPAQGKVSTILMRIADRKDSLKIGRLDPTDAREMAALDDAVARIRAINLDIWHSISRFGYPA